MCALQHEPKPLGVPRLSQKPSVICRKGGAERADKAFAALEAKYCGKPKKRKLAGADAGPSEEQFARIQQQLDNRRRKGKE